ncbi:MAG: MoaD/ThiS family protein [Cytophagales bacterium]|nr:MoaD/ThiS family protein [Armatimonadota bacterium]
MTGLMMGDRVADLFAGNQGHRGATMTVRVLLFGHYRDAAPASADSSGAFPADIAGGATVSDLAATLGTWDKRLGDLLTRTRVAVGTEFAAGDTILAPGDEVAFLPPMSGG